MINKILDLDGEQTSDYLYSLANQFAKASLEFDVPAYELAAKLIKKAALAYDAR